MGFRNTCWTGTKSGNEIWRTFRICKGKHARLSWSCAFSSKVHVGYSGFRMSVRNPVEVRWSTSMVVARQIMRMFHQSSSEWLKPKLPNGLALRIMGSQVTGGNWRCLKTPAKNTSNPLKIAGLPVILRVDAIKIMILVFTNLPAPPLKIKMSPEAGPFQNEDRFPTGGSKDFFIFIPIWGRFPYFSQGLKPPTKKCFRWC